MTAGNDKKPPAPKAPDTAPLKNALADVLKKTTPEKAPEKSSAQNARSHTPPQTAKPFEVPAETLKAIFKDQ